ncbi:MAG TPA: hypothetical protein VET89_00030 [Stellaceae bacterium]|nr:hypothetical protein [Stellaceae bacterium]
MAMANFDDDGAVGLHGRPRALRGNPFVTPQARIFLRSFIPSVVLRSGRRETAGNAVATATAGYQEPGKSRVD